MMMVPHGSREERPNKSIKFRSVKLDLKYGQFAGNPDRKADNWGILESLEESWPHEHYSSSIRFIMY